MATLHDLAERVERLPVETGVRHRYGTVSLSGGGTLTIITAIEHASMIAKIIAHLGLPFRAPPRITRAGFRSTPIWVDPQPIPDSTRFSP